MDCKEHMYQRGIYGDRITLTKDMLSSIPEVWDQLQTLAGGKTLEVRCFYRYSSFL